MAIKKLQKDYTTPEQSKRLLELGVPAESANYYRLWEDGIVWVISEVDKIDWNSKVGDTPTYLPCWSVGRLIEIFFKSSKYTYILLYPQFKQMDFLMSLFKEKIKAHKLDFSKLEE